MKSLTEQQLRNLLKEAWEESAAQFQYECGGSCPNGPTEKMTQERDALFDKLIASV